MALGLIFFVCKMGEGGYYYLSYRVVGILNKILDMEAFLKLLSDVLYIC